MRSPQALVGSNNRTTGNASQLAAMSHAPPAAQSCSQQLDCVPVYLPWGKRVLQWCLGHRVCAGWWSRAPQHGCVDSSSPHEARTSMWTDGTHACSVPGWQSSPTVQICTRSSAVAWTPSESRLVREKTDWLIQISRAVWIRNTWIYGTRLEVWSWWHL